MGSPFWLNDSNEIACVEKFIGDELCLQMSESLKSDSTKNCMTLRGNFLSSRSAYSLGQMLSENSSIRFISLEWNQIGSSGASFLATALEKNSTLTSLDLRNNGITDEGAIAISNSLLKNTTLENLDLRWNNIGDAGCQALQSSCNERQSRIRIQLAGNLTNLNSLTNLETSFDSGISKAAIEEFKEESLPPVLSPVKPFVPEFQPNIMQHEIAILKQQVSERTKALEESEIQLKTCAIRITDLEQSLMKERYQYEQITLLLHSTKSKLIEITNEEQLLRSQWDLERSEINEEIRRMMTEKDQENAALKSSLDVLKERLLKNEVEMKILGDTLKQTQNVTTEEIASLRISRDTAISNVATLSAKEIRLSLEIESLRSNYESASMTINRLQNELEEERVMMQQSLKTEIKKRDFEMESQLASAAKTTSTLYTELKEAREEISELKQQYTNIRIQLTNKAEKDIALARDEERIKWEALINDSKAALEVSNSERNSQAEQNVVLQAQLQLLRDEYHVAVQDMQRQIKRLQEDYENTKRIESQYKDNINKLEKEVSNCQQLLKEKNDDILRGQNEIGRLKLEYDTLHTHSQQVEQKWRDSTNKLNDFLQKKQSDFFEIQRRVTAAVQKEFDSLQYVNKTMDDIS